MTDTPDILRGIVKPGEIERAIWSAMIWAAANNPGFEKAPEYTDRGNSFAEREARAAAARVLASLDADKLRAVVEAILEHATHRKDGKPHNPSMGKVFATLAALQEPSP
jgi:hypothetical protein